MMAWRPRSPFLRASPARALLETPFVLAGALLVGALLSGVWSPGRARLLVFAALCGVLWCAVRLRLPTGAWWRRVAHDGVVGLLAGLALLPALTYAGALAYARRGIAGDVIAAIITVTACASIFLLARVGGRLWLFWDRLRRTRLRWALTHAHLVVVVAGLALFDVLLTIINVWLGRGFPLFVIAATIAVTTIMMSIVLLPAALVSFVVARGVTRRVESLAAATSRLRGGDYDSRVAVTGADEIAHLQTDFNAMAADLDRARRDLRAERDTVAALLRARQELIASVSHELRTPVATLRGYLESTRAHWDGGPPPTLRQDVDVMEREAIRLQTLIDDLFTLARADVARLELRRAPVDVGTLARCSVDAVAPLAWQSGKVEVVARVAPDLPPALVDIGRLEQVLRNLLQNAVRHTQPGGIVAVVVEADGAMVEVCVQDTGEGIAAQDLPRIWERFYRPEQSRSRATGGTGLGLALVKELTEAMGGTVGVESALGQGTCFTIRLPRLGTAAHDAPRPALHVHA
jgi:signal transduction histidine kinase